MPIATITLDTSVAGNEDIEALLLDGEVISVTGLINLKWEDFSAIDTARNSGLQGILWQSSYDDTPGSLSLTVRYSSLSTNDVTARFENRSEIEEYEMQESGV